MMHILRRHAPFAVLGLIALASATPASAQRRVPPVSRAGAPDSAIAPPRERIVPPAAPMARVPARRATPVAAEPLRPLARTQPPVVPVTAAVVVDTTVPPPAPLTRQPAPVAVQASAARVAAVRSVSPSNDPPAGATGRCKDGSYVSGAGPDASCASRGGLVVTFPAPRARP